MAQSRLEKVASIFNRVTQLHQGQNLPPEKLPLWYNIYKSFPPTYDPKYNRPFEKKPIKQIFYAEDIIRAKFQKDFAEATYTSFHSSKPSITNEFIEIYKKCAKEEAGLPENDLYNFAKNEFKKNKYLRKLFSNQITQTEEDKKDTKNVALEKINFDLLINAKK